MLTLMIPRIAVSRELAVHLAQEFSRGDSVEINFRMCVLCNDSFIKQLKESLDNQGVSYEISKLSGVLTQEQRNILSE